MKEFFAGLNTPAAIKTAYRKLAKIWHPDIGGDTETMQRINAAYHAALKKLDGFTSMGSDNQEHTYRYNYKTEQAVMDKVIEILGLGLSNLDVEIIGVWVWVSGSTRDQKDLLNRNGVGLKWHGGRKLWYFKPYKGRTRYNKSASMSDLRQAYGSRRFEADRESGMTA